MGIYDEPRYGVTNSLMRQRGSGGGGFGMGGPLSNANSLYAGGSPPQDAFSVGSSNANSMFGGMGMAGGGVVPQQPQMGSTMQQGGLGGGPLGQLAGGGAPAPPAGGWPQGQLDAGVGAPPPPGGFAPRAPYDPATARPWNPMTGVT